MSSIKNIVPLKVHTLVFSTARCLQPIILYCLHYISPSESLLVCCKKLGLPHKQNRSFKEYDLMFSKALCLRSNIMSALHFSK